ncbi:hypothetical protein ACFYKT_09150 [Cytobacillus sp. FJAT-53684]|uniref:Uncharacterized protein n=1 Tax=Cytobacillus mangrovibacter TaxID=3299024 RepID=A0ABW6JXC9_9BACI
MNPNQLIQEGNIFRETDKTSVREEYVAWATKVALYLEEKYPQTSIAEKTKLISQHLFMAYRVDSNYLELMGILKGICEYEQ